jgi:protein SCO1/2
MPPDTYPRLDREAPPLSLVDHRGERLALDALTGRPALVTFAFGNCETICPVIVHDTLAAQEIVRRQSAADDEPDAVPRVVIVSLDPWRDTPARLAHLADHWKLGDDAHVLSGSVAEVEAVLDAWNVARRRDPKTGDVTHPSLVYILDEQGAIAFATRGNTAAMVELLGRI